MAGPSPSSTPSLPLPIAPCPVQHSRQTKQQLEPVIPPTGDQRPQRCNEILTSGEEWMEMATDNVRINHQFRVLKAVETTAFHTEEQKSTWQIHRTPLLSTTFMTWCFQTTTTARSTFNALLVRSMAVSRFWMRRDGGRKTCESTTFYIGPGFTVRSAHESLCSYYSRSTTADGNYWGPYQHA